MRLIFVILFGYISVGCRVSYLKRVSTLKERRMLNGEMIHGTLV